MINVCIHFKQLGKQERDYLEKENANTSTLESKLVPLFQRVIFQ